MNTNESDQTQAEQQEPGAPQEQPARSVQMTMEEFEAIRAACGQLIGLYQKEGVDPEFEAWWAANNPPLQKLHPRQHPEFFLGKLWASRGWRGRSNVSPIVSASGTPIIHKS